MPGVPASSASKARVVFATLWAAADLPDPPAPHQDACVQLAAAIYCELLAGVYENSVSPAPGGVVPFAGSEKAERYQELAKFHRGAYRATLGLALDREEELARVYRARAQAEGRA